MYYTLYTRDDATEPFACQFGDYDKAAVLEERQDYIDHGAKASNIRIKRFAAADDVPTFLS